MSLTLYRTCNVPDVRKQAKLCIAVIAAVETPTLSCASIKLLHCHKSHAVNRALSTWEASQSDQSPICKSKLSYMIAWTEFWSHACIFPYGHDHTIHNACCQQPPLITHTHDSMTDTAPPPTHICWSWLKLEGCMAKSTPSKPQNIWRCILLSRSELKVVIQAYRHGLHWLNPAPIYSQMGSGQARSLVEIWWMLRWSVKSCT